MNAANRGTRVLVGGRRHGARIQDNDFGLNGRGGTLHAAVEQLTLDSRAISLGCAASEILHMICRHETIILGTNRMPPGRKCMTATKRGDFASYKQPP